MATFILQTFDCNKQFLDEGKQLLPEAFRKACESVFQKVVCWSSAQPSPIAFNIFLCQFTINYREGFDHSYFFVASFIEQHVKFHAKAMAKVIFFFTFVGSVSIKVMLVNCRRAKRPSMTLFLTSMQQKLKTLNFQLERTLFVRLLSLGLQINWKSKRSKWPLLAEAKFASKFLRMPCATLTSTRLPVKIQRVCSHAFWVMKPEALWRVLGKACHPFLSETTSFHATPHSAENLRVFFVWAPRPTCVLR